MLGQYFKKTLLTLLTPGGAIGEKGKELYFFISTDLQDAGLYTTFLMSLEGLSIIGLSHKSTIERKFPTVVLRSEVGPSLAPEMVMNWNMRLHSSFCYVRFPGNPGFYVHELRSSGSLSNWICSENLKLFTPTSDKDHTLNITLFSSNLIDTHARLQVLLLLYICLC